MKFRRIAPLYWYFILGPDGSVEKWFYSDHYVDDIRIEPRWRIRHLGTSGEKYLQNHSARWRGLVQRAKEVQARLK